MWQFLYMLQCFSESPEKFSPLSFPAMAAEGNKGDGSLTTPRQRFYVELKHGETTIVSWKKLLKEARKKDQCPLPSSGPYSSSSTVPETQDISCDAGQCNDSVTKNKRVKHVATSSDHIQQSKHRVKMTKVEGEKNDGDSSAPLARPNGMNRKVTSETKNLFKHSSSPAKDINGDAGQCNDSVTKNKRVKHVATSSDHVQQSKHKGKMTKVEGGKNDGDLSVQLVRPNGMNGKVTSETKNLFKHSSSPAKVKNHPPKEVRASTVDVPLLTYSKRRGDFRSKSKCPPLNAVEDARVPLKATHNVVQKTHNSSIEGSNMKVGVGGHSYDAMHQKIEECSPVKIDSTCRMLHDEVSSKRRHNDKSGGSREIVDAIPSRYKSPLKDSKVEKCKGIKSESFAMGHNLSDTVKTKHVQAPCKKRKATDSSRNDCNSIPYLPKKMASKKAAIELPALQRDSSDSVAKDVKLTFKQKPLVPQKSNVKVRFLLKQEHETLKSNEKDAKLPAYP